MVALLVQVKPSVDLKVEMPLALKVENGFISSLLVKVGPVQNSL